MKSLELFYIFPQNMIEQNGITESSAFLFKGVIRIKIRIGTGMILPDKLSYRN